MVLTSFVIVARAVEVPTGVEIAESASGVETEVSFVDSAEVVVAAAFGVGGILSSAEELLTSSGEAEVSDPEVIEFSEGGVVEAAEVLAFTDVLMTLFMGVVSLAEEPGPVETEVLGMVVAVPDILVLAIIVAPEADGVVAKLLEAAAIVVVAAVGIVVAAEAAVTVVVASVVPVSKVVESAEEAVALVGTVVAPSVGVVAASVAVSVVVFSPEVAPPPEGWVVVSPKLFNKRGSAVEVEVPGDEVAAPATVVLAAAAVAAATISLVAEVVTIPLAVVSSCRVVIVPTGVAAMVVTVPTGVGVEGPVGIVALEVKSVSKVVESVIPVVTSSNEAVVVITVVVSLTDAVISLLTGVAV